MADEIHVGSVSVGVVPDLRGFNDKMRRELIPASNRIGQEMGKELAKGIVDSLNLGRIVSQATVKGMVAVRESGVKIGAEFAKQFEKQFDFGAMITKKTALAMPAIRREGMLAGREYGKAFQRGFELETRRMPKPHVELDLTRARAQITALRALASRRINVPINVTGGGAGGGGGGGVLGLGAAAAGGGGGRRRGGASFALNQALQGQPLFGLASLLEGLGPAGGAAAGAAGLFALPFIGQALGGLGIAGLGGGLAGLGIAGAAMDRLGKASQVTGSQMASAHERLISAQDRLKAAQERLSQAQGKGGASAGQLQSASLRVLAAQQRLNELQHSGTATASQLTGAHATLASAQDRLSQLQHQGGKSAGQLASAQAAVQSAMASVNGAQDQYNKLRQQDKTAEQTKRVKEMQTAWKNLGGEFHKFMHEIGTAFVPVLTDIFGQANKLMVALTPVFKNAMGVIAGPFNYFVDNIISALADPQVQSAITAVATAFADILKAFTPDVKGIIDSFADAVERVAQAVSKNPKAFADFLNFLFQIGIFAINAIAFLTNLAVFMETRFKKNLADISRLFGEMQHEIAHDFDTIRHAVAAAWDWMWQHTVGATIRNQRHLQILISDWLHNIAHWFDIGRHWVASIWDDMWQATIGAAIRQQRHLQQLITAWLHNLAHWFDVARHDVAAAWDTMWNNTIGRAVHGWQDLYNKVWVPVRNFFQQTLPGWFDTGVKKIGQFWANVQNTVRGPVNWVINYVLNPLGGAFNTITNALHIPAKIPHINQLAPAHAAGGLITAGTHETADDVLIRVSKHETVLSAAHSRMLHPILAAVGVPGHGAPTKGEVGYDHFSGTIGLATGGQIEQTMLNFMTSKVGSPYSQAQRWGRPPWDCSSFLWDAATHAKIPMPQSVATAAPEADWLSHYDGNYFYTSRGKVQTGDVIFARGAAPTPSSFGGIGHVGMAASPGRMISALGSKYGVTFSGIPNDFVVGVRFGGANTQGVVPTGGGAGLGGLIPGILGALGKAAVRSLEQLVPGLHIVGDMLSEKNLSFIFDKFAGKVAPGAGGILKDILTNIPKTLVNGVKNFIKSHAPGVSSGGGGVPGAHTAGVERWRSVVLHALSMLHEPASLVNAVLYQMQTESGGDQAAQNNTDINAARGTPSKGLMQVIDPTFRAYHVPGTSNNIWDPLANIAAAINYAIARYGPSLMSGGQGIGSGHGYALGTAGAAPGWAWVGELGPELVNFRGGEQVVPITRGYATGTSINTLQAEIRRYQASINILQRRMANYPGTAGAAERRLLSAQIAVDQAHIRDLQKRIYTVEHTTPALHAAVTKMGNAGATLAANLAKITPATTTASLDATQRLALKDLRLYFSPATANARSRLIISQINQMKSLETQIKNNTANIKAANDFQKATLTHLQQGTGLSAIGIQGQGTAQGRSLLTGLNRQVTDIRNFGNTLRNLHNIGAPLSVIRQVAGMAPDVGSVYGNKMITLLKKLKGLKVPAAMINQLVAMGPDAGLAYADALLHADKRTLQSIIAAESTLGATQLAVSRGAASVAYGGGYNTGANFIKGLQSQQKALEKMFGHLGRVMAQEAIRWFGVPAKQRPYGYQHGGWINEPISGIGMYSGASYTFAERGREYVIPDGNMPARGGDGGTAYHAHFDGLTLAVIEQHVRTAFHAMEIQHGALQRNGRRSL